MKNQINQAKKLLESNGYSVSNESSDTKKWRVTIEDEDGERYKYFEDYKTALKWSEQYAYNTLSLDTYVSDPELVDEESLEESTDSDYYWSGFGYSVYQRDGKYEVVAGEGDVVYTADTTFDAKKWCKEHKTSSKWAADGKWDWTRESVNKSLPKWQAIEYTKDGPETHVFQTEEEAKAAIKEWKASGSETKGPTPITRQDNFIDEDQDYRDDSDDDRDFVEWDPFDGKKYRVSYLEAYGDDATVKTNDPKEAIEAWFKYGQDHPTYAFIDAKYKTDAIDLCKAATAELLTDLYSKYKCHYKLDYLISESQKKVEDGQKYFRESGDYGDSVHPFGCG